nr:hypothetical protein [Tanacetum cinerariifolium]
AEDVSPIAQSPEYVPESDFEMHPEDDGEEDPEEDHVDYPADGGDDDDDEEESLEDEEDDEMDGAPVSTDTELGGYVREFESSVRQHMDEIYTRLDDEQTERQLLASRLNMLFRDRRAHAHTRLLMEAEARITVLGQIPKIRELQDADRRRQTVILELLRLEHRRSTETSESRTALQGKITALQGQVAALQAQVATLQGLARDSTHPEPPEEAGGSA